MATPPFRVYLPFLAKNFVPPKWLKWGGSNYGQWIVKVAEKASKTKFTNHDSDCENEEM